MEDNSNVVLEYIQPERWWKRAKWKLVEDFESHSGIWIEKGFITDGVSVPRPFTIFFSPTGEAFKASIVHDYIIITQDNWELANVIFKRELELSGISSFRRSIIYGAVSLWAKLRKNGFVITIDV